MGVNAVLLRLGAVVFQHGHALVLHAASAVCRVAALVVIHVQVLGWSLHPSGLWHVRARLPEVGLRDLGSWRHVESLGDLVLRLVVELLHVHGQLLLDLGGPLLLGLPLVGPCLLFLIEVLEELLHPEVDLLLNFSLDERRDLLLSQASLLHGVEVGVLRGLSSNAAEVLQLATGEHLDAIGVEGSVWWAVGVAEVAAVVPKMAGREHVALGP